MKRLIFLLLLATTAAAQESVAKRRLVSELLQVIDAKEQLRTSFEIAMSGPDGVETAEDAEARQLSDRIFTRVDYDRYFAEALVPLFEERFTEEDLQTLVDFFRTKAGQKYAALQPRLGLGTAGLDAIRAASEVVRQEVDAEKRAKYPWLPTVEDLQVIAVAVESYATDANTYPNVTFDQLRSELAPTYILEIPAADVWGTPYFYIANAEHYRIVSAGADRRFEAGSRQLEEAPEPRFSDDPEADIIFQDGVFVQAPPGAEHRD